jgi:hypothetical protein
MKESLEKIIKKLLLRKYPIIEDFEIIVDTFRPPIGVGKKIGHERYRVNYFVTRDGDGTFERAEDMRNVEELTTTLFKLLGPAIYQKLEGVDFYLNKN